jgi:hypothetical protein
MDGSKDLMKQMKACETRFKQPQKRTRLNPKPTPKNKRNKTKKKHKSGRHLQI